MLGICVVVCLATGLVSHWIQHPPGWFAFPTDPPWLYRVSQGLHVITGTAAIPLLLIKLQLVYPRLFARPVIGTPLRAAERLSIAVLVSSMIFQLFTGLMNTAQFYPWRFFFTTTHYAMSFVVVAALLVHIAVKLPIIQAAFRSPLGSTEAIDNEPVTGERGVSRRAILGGSVAAAGLAVVAFAGQTVPFLRWVSFLAPRSGEGPQGVPVNRTASAAGVVDMARAADYVLTVVADGRSRALTLDDLRRLPQHDSDLPIACVEGWSAEARWRGVRVRDLVAMVGGDPDRAVRVVSLERGMYGESLLPAAFARHPSTLVALELHGEPLTVDHGYPCRLIAPNRPGVLQTKWLSRIEVT
nr:molybdopterin-dependent oxidoreductase [Williamsia serinedens]